VKKYRVSSCYSRWYI